MHTDVLVHKYAGTQMCWYTDCRHTYHCLNCHMPHFRYHYQFLSHQRNPFSIVTTNLKNFPHSNLIVILHSVVMEHPQEVVFYCESRSWAMMNAIEHADDEKANWVLSGINFELVSSKSRIVPDIDETPS
jgi:hypothetical protein